MSESCRTLPPGRLARALRSRVLRATRREGKQRNRCAAARGGRLLSKTCRQNLTRWCRPSLLCNHAYHSLCPSQTSQIHADTQATGDGRHTICCLGVSAHVLIASHARMMALAATGAAAPRCLRSTGACVSCGVQLSRGRARSSSLRVTQRAAGRALNSRAQYFVGLGARFVSRDGPETDSAAVAEAASSPHSSPAAHARSWPDICG